MLADLIDSPYVFPALITLCGGLLAYALIYPFLARQARAAKRLESVTLSTERVVRTAQVDVGMRKRQVSETLKDLESRQKKSKRIPLEDRIHQTGLDFTVRKFVLFCVCSAVLGGIGAFAFFQTMVSVAVAVPITGLALPFWALRYLRNKRMKKFIAEFPNAVDVIVRGVKSGLPLGDCLRIIANEAAEPVAGEFRHIVDVQQIGLNIGEACQELYKRVPTSEANFFGIVIEIQQKSGGNLAEVLSNLSKVLRERRKMKGKIIAMSTEATASAAIIAALPFIVGTLVFLSAPSYIELLWQREAGQHAMMASAVWMSLGIFVMKKMINFDF